MTAQTLYAFPAANSAVALYAHPDQRDSAFVAVIFDGGAVGDEFQVARFGPVFKIARDNERGEEG
jgi:hypothetical protein